MLRHAYTPSRRSSSRSAPSRSNSFESVDGDCLVDSDTHLVCGLGCRLTQCSCNPCEANRSHAPQVVLNSAPSRGASVTARTSFRANDHSDVCGALSGAHYHLNRAADAFEHKRPIPQNATRYSVRPGNLPCARRFELLRADDLSMDLKQVRKWRRRQSATRSSFPYLTRRTTSAKVEHLGYGYCRPDRKRTVVA